MLRSGFLAALGLAALGASCALNFTDYPVAEGPTGAGAAAGTSHGVSVGTSVSTGSSTSNGASSSTGSGLSKLGVVIASQNAQASYGEADFGKDAAAFPPSCLELIPVGTCEKYACNGSNATASAGVITIKSSSHAIVLMPDATGAYSQQQSGAALWQPGESVTIHAQGADVPMFQLSLAGPAVPTITSPPPPTAMLTINRSAGVAFQWSGPTSGQIYVYLGAASPSQTAVECVFDGAAGMGFIPPSALGDFQAQEVGSLVIASLNQNTVVSGDWSVTAKLETVAYDNDCTFQ